MQVNACGIKEAEANAATIVNSEGFLAEVFHPWVRWEGPESRFESSPGGASGIWKSGIWPPGDRGHNRATVSGRWAYIESVHTIVSRSIFAFMSEHHDSCYLDGFEILELVKYIVLFVNTQCGCAGI